MPCSTSWMSDPSSRWSSSTTWTASPGRSASAVAARQRADGCPTRPRAGPARRPGGRGARVRARGRSGLRVLPQQDAVAANAAPLLARSKAGPVRNTLAPPSPTRRSTAAASAGTQASRGIHGTRAGRAPTLAPSSPRCLRITALPRALRGPGQVTDGAWMGQLARARDADHATCPRATPRGPAARARVALPAARRGCMPGTRLPRPLFA